MMIRIKEPKMPIKKGDYVRIKYMNWLEKIGRITQILEKDPYYKDMQMYGVDVCVQHTNGHYPAHKIYEEDIIDYDKDLIKLIKAGDYVNGYKVKRVFLDPFTKETRICLEIIEMNWQGDMSEKYIESQDIKSIATKEDFEKINYKVRSD